MNLLTAFEKFIVEHTSAPAHVARALVAETKAGIQDLQTLIATILRNQEITMSKIDDLNASITKLAGVVNDAAATIKTEMETIATAHASDDSDALGAATERVNAMADQLTTAMAGLTSTASIAAAAGADTLGTTDTLTGSGTDTLSGSTSTDAPQAA